MYVIMCVSIQGCYRIQGYIIRRAVTWVQNGVDCVRVDDLYLQMPSYTYIML